MKCSEGKGVNFAGFLLSVDGDENVFGVVVDKKNIMMIPKMESCLKALDTKSLAMTAIFRVW